MTQTRLVVADAGPIHALVRTGDVDRLPARFDRVIVPERVCEELVHARAPALVRAWIAAPPEWFGAQAVGDRPPEPDLEPLDAGEREAIALALDIGADLLLIDDRDAVGIARKRGLAVTGTLGLLDLAARKELVDLNAAFSRLKATSFYYREGLLDDILRRRKNDDDTG